MGARASPFYPARMPDACFAARVVRLQLKNHRQAEKYADAQSTSHNYWNELLNYWYELLKWITEMNYWNELLKRITEMNYWMTEMISWLQLVIALGTASSNQIPFALFPAPSMRHRQ